MWKVSLLQAVRVFVSEVAARRALTRGTGATLIVEPDAVEVLGPDRERLICIDGRLTDTVRAVADRIATDPEGTVALEFGAALTVTGSFVLPAETEDVLRAIVRNKVEGLAPWPLTRSLVGQRTKSIPGDPAHVRVDVAVVSRGLLEEIVERLFQASVTVANASARLADGATVPLDFSDQEEHRAAERRAIRSGLAVAGIALGVLGLGLFLDLKIYLEGASYREKTARLMAALPGESDDIGPPLIRAANRLYSERERRPAIVAVLNELTKVLPDSVWLSTLKLDDDKLELKGQGRDVPSLIKLIESSELLREVNFADATQLNEESQADAFAIRAILEQFRARPGP